MDAYKLIAMLGGLVALLAAPARANTCPTPWITVNGQCRPNLPSTDYYRDPMDNYPVCGPERVPVKLDGSNWTTLNFASSFAPRSSNPLSLSGGGTIDYTASATSPNYYYSNMPRCMCASKSYPATPKVTTAPALLPVYADGTTLRFYPDSKSVIEQTQTGATHIASKYSPVSVSKRNVPTPPNARLGTEVQAGKSFCRCPNFNEEMVPVLNNANQIVGSYCRSRVPNHGVLKDFVKATHDPFMPSNPSAGISQIMDRNDELNEAGELIEKINVYDGSPNGSTYQRRIWTCEGSYQLNTTTGNCEMNFAFHAAGRGNGTTIPPSPVSPRVGGLNGTPEGQWDNTVNKKFAACLNGFGTITAMTATAAYTTPKFDCLANNFVKYNDFNDLWASTDRPADGGLMNAIVLANALGKPISGFYTQDGAHCDEYSEFAGELIPMIVNPKLGNSSSADLDWKQATGPALVLPGKGDGGSSAGTGGSTLAYSELQTGMIGKLLAMANAGLIPNNSSQNYVPTTAAERRKCPLLVRAAAVYTCPDNVPSATMVSYVETDPSDPTRILRAQCPVAKDVKIHMRIEQLTEIKGQPKMPTIDTITNSTGNSQVTLQRLIAEKYGVECPKGTVRNQTTGACDLQ